MITGSLLAIAGMLLFAVDRSSTTYIAADSVVTLFGVIGILIPIVNMITLSLPYENVATGLGLNTMLRNIGGALGPVVATTLLSTYTTAVHLGPSVVALPDATAFNTIFYLGALVLALAVVISITSKNYTFRRDSASPA